MNKLEQAAQQALEALREYRDTQMIQAPRRVIEALREALAEQAEQEPVCIDWDTKTDEPIMGYAAPVRAKDLTDDEIWEIEEKLNRHLREFPIKLARAVIAAANEREACAKVCEEIEQDRWNLYKGRPPYTGSESGRADPHEQGVSMGAGECAAAIRARGNNK